MNTQSEEGEESSLASNVPTSFVKLYPIVSPKPSTFAMASHNPFDEQDTGKSITRKKYEEDLAEYEETEETDDIRYSEAADEGTGGFFGPIEESDEVPSAIGRLTQSSSIPIGGPGGHPTVLNFSLPMPFRSSSDRLPRPECHRTQHAHPLRSNPVNSSTTTPSNSPSRVPSVRHLSNSPPQADFPPFNQAELLALARQNLLREWETSRTAPTPKQPTRKHGGKADYALARLANRTHRPTGTLLGREEVPDRRYSEASGYQSLRTLSRDEQRGRVGGSERKVLVSAPSVILAYNQKTNIDTAQREATKRWDIREQNWAIHRQKRAMSAAREHKANNGRQSRSSHREPTNDDDDRMAHLEATLWGLGTRTSAYASTSAGPAPIIGGRPLGSVEKKAGKQQEKDEPFLAFCRDFREKHAASGANLTTNQQARKFEEAHEEWVRSQSSGKNLQKEAKDLVKCSQAAPENSGLGSLSSLSTSTPVSTQWAEIARNLRHQVGTNRHATTVAPSPLRRSNATAGWRAFRTQSSTGARPRHPRSEFKFE